MAILLSATVNGLAGSKRPKNITFHRNVNAFWGLNGSGKTSFLKIIHSALTNDASMLIRVPFESAKVRFQSHRGEIFESTISKSDETISIMSSIFGDYDPDLLTDEQRIFLRREMTHRTARSARRERDGIWAWKISPEPKHPSAHFFHRYLPTSRLTTGSDSRVYRPNAQSTAQPDVLTEATYDKVFAKNIQAIWEHYSRQELIQEREIQQNGLANILSSVLERTRVNAHGDSEVEAEAAYEALTSFFKAQRLAVKPSRSHFLKSYEKDALLRSVVAKITDVERQIAEAQAPSRKLESLLKRLYTGRKEVKLDRNISVTLEDQAIPIELLSSGEKQMLLILLETLAAGTHSIIIDEPEISMHVDWQQSVVESMQTVNPNAQIIIATHSPEVMVGIPDENVIEL